MASWRSTEWEVLQNVLQSSAKHRSFTILRLFYVNSMCTWFPSIPHYKKGNGGGGSYLPLHSGDPPPPNVHGACCTQTTQLRVKLYYSDPCLLVDPLLYDCSDRASICLCRMCVDTLFLWSQQLFLSFFQSYYKSCFGRQWASPQ